MTDQYVDVLGARIRYRSEGQGPSVLLLHGIGASLEIWNWTIPALRDSYTTTVFDFPGFGRSEPMESAFTPEGAARAVLAFMDAIDLRTTAIVGSSMGGAITSLVAGTAPQRFAAVVLADPAGFDTGLTGIMRLQTLPGIGEIVLPLARFAPRLSLSLTFHDPHRIPTELVRIVCENAGRPVTGRTYLRVLRTYATLSGLRLEYVYAVRHAAGKIAAPTLIVWGERDPVIPPVQLNVALQTIPGAKRLVMRDAGHVPFVEDPETFNRALLAFLSEVFDRDSIGVAP